MYGKICSSICSCDICHTPTNKQKDIENFWNENLMGFDIDEITVSTIIVDMYVWYYHR